MVCYVLCDYDFSLRSSGIQDTLFLAHLMFRPYKFVIFSHFYYLLGAEIIYSLLLHFLKKNK